MPHVKLHKVIRLSK